MPSNDQWSLLSGDAWEVAPLLLGWVVERELDGHILRGRIVETEAYDQTDAASHSYRGRTPRTEVMFGLPGHLYVYFTYGMHYCCNIVTGPEGHGSAVLIRAVEPVTGKGLMTELRGGKGGAGLTNGPAKVCQAFGIDRKWNGHDLLDRPLRLIPAANVISSSDIVISKRIGITQDTSRLWRFYIRGNPYVSRP